MIQTKYNDATHNRPDGERVIDANFVFSDLPAYAEQIKGEKSWVEGDRNAITVFKSPQMTITLMAMKNGAKVEDSQSDNFISIQVIAGGIHIQGTDMDFEVGERHIISLHPGIKHSFEALKESLLLLTTLGEQVVR